MIIIEEGWEYVIRVYILFLMIDILFKDIMVLGFF